MELFEHFQNSSGSSEGQSAPLPERLRPQSLDEIVGQSHIVDPNLPLIKNLREKNYLPNLILWGPPGTGKTTFAKLLGREIKAHFEICNAVGTGAKDLRDLGEAAHNRKLIQGERTVLFIDEIHRLNRAQQDVLLPFTENGDLILIGATTENPSYEMNAALLSRARVLVFESLSESDLHAILGRAAKKASVCLDDILTAESQNQLIRHSSGDARQLLNDFEYVLQLQTAPGQLPLKPELLEKLLGDQRLRYDRAGDQHYDVISAFIKSVRGSDPDAAVYYLARMLEGGEDPVFIARRLVILASEDIGNADPRALPLAVAGLQAVELVGMPEARISLAQVTTYLAACPKSNRSYKAIGAALEFVKKTGALAVPKSLRSAQTKMAKDLGHGAGYKYAHDFARGFAEQNFLPAEAAGQKFYEPSEFGFEKSLKQHLQWLRGEDGESHGGEKDNQDESK